ncbi:phage tail protein I [Francisella sp. SYW-9]|uniref:phage tail protein I n=1 Tax=Francisella sp. SYW-9 TaxID=2610888 RepID=UPI00123CCBEC|nr:phage tail protein I [Francisella sp. SYW-9]
MSFFPPNTTELERNIIQSFKNVLDQKDILIDKLYNTKLCPDFLLLYLAYFMDVDFSIYNSLSDQQKREYILQSIAIHRKKGTSGALKDALNIGGYTFNIIEWYQDNSTAGTAKLKLQTQNKEFEIDKVKNIVNKNKNVQTIINYIIDTSNNATLYCGGAVKIRLKITGDINAKSTTSNK